MRSTPRRRSRLPCKIDGLKVRVIDDPTAAAVDVGHALRTLARMLVRNYRRADGDHQAITTGSESSPALTVLPHSRPHHDEDEAA